MSRPPTRTLLLMGAVVALLGGGCTSSLDRAVSTAPVLAVVTGLWPLGQTAAAIGGDKVAVDDLVPAGADPLTYDPGAAGARVMDSAGLVLEIGGGFQPALEQAAAGAPTVVRLGAALKTADPYVWLDPATLEEAVTTITGAMAAANPAAASLYRRNAEGLRAQIESLQSDYSSTLSTCPGNTVVTPDNAFSTMAREFDLNDLVIDAAATEAQIAAARGRLGTGATVAVVSEPWVDDAGVQKVAGAGGAPVRQIDTLAGTPTGGPGGPNAFYQLMEDNLNTLSSALGCNNNEQ